jgi:hypothetical protein
MPRIYTLISLRQNHSCSLDHLVGADKQSSRHSKAERRKRAYGPGDAPLRKPITGSRCCARAASGHTAAPPSNAMNSRRFI